MSTVLQVENLSVDFWVDGVWYAAAKNLSFALESGKALAIVGESGSGKSTVAMALGGLLPRNAKVSGSVKLAGVELIGLDNRQLR